MLDAVVRQRYPADRDPRAGPVRLAAIPSLRSGWIADNTTWKSGLTQICPAEEFPGDLAKSSWLPSGDLAFIYRTYATYDNPLKIVSPAPIDRGGWVHEPATRLRIEVDDSKFAGWTKLECFDGAKRRRRTAQPAGPAHDRSARTWFSSVVDSRDGPEGTVPQFKSGAGRGSAPALMPYGTSERHRGRQFPEHVPRQDQPQRVRWRLLLAARTTSP